MNSTYIYKHITFKVAKKWKLNLRSSFFPTVYPREMASQTRK